MSSYHQQAASIAINNETSLPRLLAGQRAHLSRSKRMADFPGKPRLADDTKSLLRPRKLKRFRRATRVAKQVGQYRLVRRLGAGGMGEVFLAEHKRLGRLCAIKLIRAEQAGDPNALARFEREAKLTARLSHWNTAQVYDYGRTKCGAFYYVMEYLPGLNLQELLAENGPLPGERVIHLLRQVCQSLSEAHGMGLVHRDIKPANIFAAQRGGLCDVAKLLDFGLVKPLADPMSPRLTQDGAISGTPLFMSPEQARDAEQVDARSDIYSLGAVAYTLLAGRPPFEGKTPIAVMMAHAHDAVMPPSRLLPNVPADLEAVVLRCLAKRPEDRFQSAESLGQALSQCGTVDQWTQDRAAKWWQERNEAKKTVRQVKGGGDGLSTINLKP